VVASPETELARFVWETRYRDPDALPAERGTEDSWNRVAAAVAEAESDAPLWRGRFLGILHGFRFLPGGRILAGAGTRRQVTLFNCFVMGLIDDSIGGHLRRSERGRAHDAAGRRRGLRLLDASPSRQSRGATGAVASGPVSFMHVWDAMCATILSTGARRGAMMATLRCDHPDIEEFIEAKRTPNTLNRFNLSVLVTDAFMQAVDEDLEWPLVFPERLLHQADGTARCVQRPWSGSASAVPCRVRRVVAARELWQRLCDSAYDSAEPGVLFIDRINAANNLGYCESLSATNPCAEEPLPPYGACNLGSINLTAFVADPFTQSARLDYRAIRETAGLAVRFLDDVIEISHFPLRRQRDQVHRSRRIGLGITGLADALTMLTLRYDSEPARQTAGRIMEAIRDAAYEASAELAREKGAFPQFRVDGYLERPFIRSLPAELQTAIRHSGIRNSHLTAIAPAGTISLLANNVSSGIEPSFGSQMTRRVLCMDGSYRSFQTTSYASAVWRSGGARGAAARLPPYFVDAAGIEPRDQLLMQAALQPYVDGAISKTIALPAAFARPRVSEILRAAFDLGLKGCTLHREGARAAVVAVHAPAQGVRAVSAMRTVATPSAKAPRLRAAVARRAAHGCGRCMRRSVRALRCLSRPAGRAPPQRDPSASRAGDRAPPESPRRRPAPIDHRDAGAQRLVIRVTRQDDERALPLLRKLSESLALGSLQERGVYDHGPPSHQPPEPVLASGSIPARCLRSRSDRQASTVHVVPETVRPCRRVHTTDRSRPSNARVHRNLMTSSTTPPVHELAPFNGSVAVHVDSVELGAPLRGRHFATQVFRSGTPTADIRPVGDPYAGARSVI
jgi:ribonucleoside-diphosphate reductase alpha chain